MQHERCPGYQLLVVLCIGIIIDDYRLLSIFRMFFIFIHWFSFLFFWLYLISSDFSMIIILSKGVLAY